MASPEGAPSFEGEGAYTRGSVNHFESNPEKEAFEDKYEELVDSEVPLAKHVAGLSNEQKMQIESEVLNIYGLTEMFFDDEDVDGDFVIEKLNELFSEEDSDKRRFLAKSIADKLNI